MPNEGVGSARVPSAFGVWSVVAAVGSLFLPIAVVGTWLAWATSGPGDDGWSATVAVSNRVGLLIGWGIAAVAVVFGVISIRLATSRGGQPGRTLALALGWVVIGIAMLLSLFFFPLGLVRT